MPTAGAGDLLEFASSPEGAEQAADSSAPSRVSAAAWGQTPPWRKDPAAARSARLLEVVLVLPGAEHPQLPLHLWFLGTALG